MEVFLSVRVRVSGHKKVYAPVGGKETLPEAAQASEKEKLTFVKQPFNVIRLVNTDIPSLNEGKDCCPAAYLSHFSFLNKLLNEA